MRDDGFIDCIPPLLEHPLPRGTEQIFAQVCPKSVKKASSTEAEKCPWNTFFLFRGTDLENLCLWTVAGTDLLSLPGTQLYTDFYGSKSGPANFQQQRILYATIL